jgi:hypothetical protein
VGREFIKIIRSAGLATAIRELNGALEVADGLVPEGQWIPCYLSSVLKINSQVGDWMSAPLVSFDLIIRDPDGRALLRLRTNDPAKGFYFVPGGRILEGSGSSERRELDLSI